MHDDRGQADSPVALEQGTVGVRPGHKLEEELGSGADVVIEQHECSSFMTAC